MHAEVEGPAGARPPAGRTRLDSSPRPSLKAADREQLPREKACEAGSPS